MRRATIQVKSHHFCDLTRIKLLIHLASKPICDYFSFKAYQATQFTVNSLTQYGNKSKFVTVKPCSRSSAYCRSPHSSAAFSWSFKTNEASLAILAFPSFSE